MVALTNKEKMRGYTITVPTEVYWASVRIAQQEGRSFNKQVTQALREMLANRAEREAEARGSAA